MAGENESTASYGSNDYRCEVMGNTVRTIERTVKAEGSSTQQSSQPSNTPITFSRLDYRDYTIVAKGIISQGNRYDTRSYATPEGPRTGYHYSNQDGSYYYSNPNGTQYYNSGEGYSRYTREDGSGWEQQRVQFPPPARTESGSDRPASGMSSTTSSSPPMLTPPSSSYAGSDAGYGMQGTAGMSGIGGFEGMQGSGYGYGGVGGY